jgi:hypothetical protein
VSDHSEYVKNPTTETADRGESRELAADMLFGAGATLAVASVVMLFVHDPAEPARTPPAPAESPKVTIAPALGPRSAGLGAALHF